MRSGEVDTGRRLRVLTLTESLGHGGGGERIAREIAIRLDPERFERWLCVTRWSERAAARPAEAGILAELEASGVRIIRVQRRSPRQLLAWRPLVQTLREESPDIIHAHKFGSNFWAAIFGTLARTPVVVAHEQTWSYHGQPVRRFLDRELIARRADAFVAVSEEDRRRMIEIERVAPSRIRLIPNGVPPAEPSGHDVRAELGIPREAPVIGSVGALREQKRHDLLIRASAVLRGEFPDLRVLIAGEGRRRWELERLISELDLHETVSLLGRRADVPDLVRTFDLAVSSSDYEGTPLAVMEYMQAGRPVVATKVGGVPELIQDGVSGILVDPDDGPGLATAIAELLRHPDRAAAMGARGPERWRRDYDIAATVRRVERLYEELYAASSTGWGRPA
jgi:glycosyltransferase involved in cell wall biosynthesis